MEIQSPEVLPTPEHVATLERLGDEIAALSAHLDAAMARLLNLIREFDAREGWNTGFRSCADWLSWRVGLDKGAARERVRVARALGTLPRLAGALASGESSYSKARALTRVATPETEERLLGVARAGTAVHVERIVRGWRYMDRQAELEASARQQACDASRESSGGRTDACCPTSRQRRECLPIPFRPSATPTSRTDSTSTRERRRRRGAESA